jgi:hypothetical protein
MDATPVMRYGIRIVRGRENEARTISLFTFFQNIEFLNPKILHELLFDLSTLLLCFFIFKKAGSEEKLFRLNSSLNSFSLLYEEFSKFIVTFLAYIYPVA